MEQLQCPCTCGAQTEPNAAFIATLRIAAEGRSCTRRTGSAWGMPQGAVTPNTNLQGQSPKLVLLEAEAKEHLAKEVAPKG